MSNSPKAIPRKSSGSDNDSLGGLSVEDRELISRIRSRNLSYLKDDRMRCLVESCRRIEAEGTAGIFIEAGCALGGSTILISSIKKSERPLRVYDVFGMIPPPTRDDPEEVHHRYSAIKSGSSNGIGGDRYYGYEENLYELVLSNLAQFGIDCESNRISLVKGLLQDTMSIEGPVAFAHIDVDWYEPVKCCLERVVPNLSPSGVIILDDYRDWQGCRKATDEYFQGRSSDFYMDDSAGSLKITKRKS